MQVIRISTNWTILRTSRGQGTDRCYQNFPPNNRTIFRPTTYLKLEVREQIRDEIRSAIRDSTIQILEEANSNTIKLMEKERNHYAPHLLEKITCEITSAKKATWKSDINRTNFNDVKEAEQFFGRAERFVEATESTKETEIRKE